MIHDIAILGTGPAGQAAAAEALRHGAATVHLAAPSDPASGVWGVGGGPPAPFRIDALHEGGTASWLARALVVCDGAVPRMIPFPGWEALQDPPGSGCVPATEVTRLLGARHAWRAEAGGWVPVLDAWQRSTMRLLYAAGDSAGLGPEAVARADGARAARTALADLGCIAAGPPRPMCAAQAAPPSDWAALIPPGCVVCPCEGLTRATIDAALDEGARDVNQLRQFTRCGMGVCQGRLCAEAVAELAALRLGGRAAAGIWTARLPLRPLPLDAVLGAFTYADIPVPPPAPL